MSAYPRVAFKITGYLRFTTISGEVSVYIEHSIQIHGPSRAEDISITDCIQPASLVAGKWISCRPITSLDKSSGVNRRKCDLCLRGGIISVHVVNATFPSRGARFDLALDATLPENHLR
ncbi:pentatricopeptide repeat-containing protein [Corchorus olitorius]|uniref:Pentatricopeptide repeat-containing protein n=1 Tax=Corchorus olitorius TaxID=93759 RepID=A0A1R3I615_9ROSI|nr:pentatricopeptide repeat-containing protein [Corchorus olitorius]